MSSVYDIFFANNLRRIWNLGHSPSPPVGSKDLHPRRESKMARSLTHAFRPASDSTCKSRTGLKIKKGNHAQSKFHPQCFKNFFHKTKYLVCLGCLLICLYQLVAFLKLYFSYNTSVDAEVLIDTDPQLPGITICYNTFLFDYILCNRSDSFCILAEKCKLDASDRDDISYLTSQPEYQIDMLRKCAFRYYNNSDDLINGTDCASSWAFNGVEPCTVINADWAVPLQNKGGYSEFMYGVETHMPKHENATVALGVDVFIHSPKDIPTRHIRSYFITIGSVYKANFKKTVVHRLEPPYVTSCYNYTYQYNKNNNFKHVSEQTCYYNCIWKHLNESCGCIPRPQPFIRHYRACNLTTRQACREDIKSLKSKCGDECRVACVMDYYEYSMTKLLTLNIEYFKTYMEVFHELRGNIVVVFTHKPQITYVEIFSNIGGYLGIWLGMSVPLLYDLIIYTLFTLFRSIVGFPITRHQRTL